MKYNFDEEINRKGTNSLKWEFIQSEQGPLKVERTDKFYGVNRSLPMWVADMDFQSSQPIIDAVVERSLHGIYGYSQKDDHYFEAVISWMQKRHYWQIEKNWITSTPGVVPALVMLVRTFVKPGEKVIIQPPVYFPFYLAVEFNQAEIVRNPLVYKDGSYKMDFEDLKTKARDPKVKMLILCSPHNPVGRVWTTQELKNLGEICLQNRILVVSDEIHGDLVYKSNVFTPFAKISRDFAQFSVTCTSPSKTFNLAGLSTSNIIIPNEELRNEFDKTLLNNAFLDVSIFGSVALQAAYNQGDEWLDQVLDYLEGNLNYLEEYIRKDIPKIRVIHPEGTYLVWLDCRALGLDKDQLKHLMVDEAHVYLDEGYIFGLEGEGFERINIACPRSIMKEALERMKKAIDNLGKH